MTAVRDPSVSSIAPLGSRPTIRWELGIFLLLAVAPLLVPALEGAVGGQVTTLFIYGILALALNVMVGFVGCLHLGIAAFFGIGGYTAAILTVPTLGLEWPFAAAVVAAVVVAAGAGLLLAAPCLRLRGDYLALVTLGFGEVVKVTLRNLENITGGMKGLGPLPPPGDGLTVAGLDVGRAFAVDPRWFYELSLMSLAIVVAGMEWRRRLHLWVFRWHASSSQPSPSLRPSPGWQVRSTPSRSPPRPTPTPTTSTGRSSCSRQ
jgi:ABC-type branched-subunit amino acid transport system permease subunit